MVNFFRDMHLRNLAQRFEQPLKLLTCLMDYISVERKQDTFNTSLNIIQTGRAKCCFFMNALI